MRRCDSCRALPGVECEGVSAFWTYYDGVTVGLCLKSLNYWLDFADEDPDLEPMGLIISVDGKEYIYAPA